MCAQIIKKNMNEPSRGLALMGAIVTVAVILYYIFTGRFPDGDEPSGIQGLILVVLTVVVFGGFAVNWLWWWYRYGRHMQKSPDDEIKKPSRYNN